MCGQTKKVEVPPTSVTTVYERRDNGWFYNAGRVWLTSAVPDDVTPEVLAKEGHALAYSLPLDVRDVRTPPPLPDVIYEQLHDRNWHYSTDGGKTFKRSVFRSKELAEGAPRRGQIVHNPSGRRVRFYEYNEASGFRDNDHYERAVPERNRVPREYRWIGQKGEVRDLRMIDDQYLANINAVCSNGGKRANGSVMEMTSDRLGMCMNASFEEARRAEQKRAKELIFPREMLGTFVGTAGEQPTLTRAEITSFRRTMPNFVADFLKDNTFLESLNPNDDLTKLTYADAMQLVSFLEYALRQTKRLSGVRTPEQEAEFKAVARSAEHFERIMRESLTDDLREFDREISEG